MEQQDRLVWKASAEGAFVDLSIRGCWIASSVRPSLIEITGAFGPSVRSKTIRIHDDGLSRWDSTFIAFLLKLRDHASAHGAVLDLSLLSENARQLVDLATRVPPKDTARTDKKTGFLDIWKNAGLAFAGEAKEMLVFIGELAFAFQRLFMGKSQMRRHDLLFFIDEAGPKALPIVCLISMLVGLILAFVGAIQLKLFGAEIYVADLVGIGMTREMGAIMAAIIMAGRTGAAYAAQLGTMQVNEEVDAFRTCGFDVMDFLVMPRMLALIITMPMLCLFANLLGMLGGAIVTIGMPEVSLLQYYNQTLGAIDIVDVSIGVFKGLVFGGLVSMAGCLRGIRCGRNATAVGQATTSAVVTGIVAIIMADSALTVILNILGI